MGLLPNTIKKVETEDPKNLIIFGLPKVGKTTALSKLPNCLIVDLEGGTKYVEGYVVEAKTIKELNTIAKELKEGNHNFKFVVIDTITCLEEMVLPYAKMLYMKTAMGKNYDGDDVRTLPKGAGYLYIREAVKDVVDWFNSTGLNVILVGHVKDTSLTEGSTELSLKTLDLNGKLANILSAESDAICYLYRDPETLNLMANFGDMNSVLCGARLSSLAGKTILLAERVQEENGNYGIVTHWDSIFHSIKQ